MVRTLHEGFRIAGGSRLPGRTAPDRKRRPPPWRLGPEKRTPVGRDRSGAMGCYPPDLQSPREGPEPPRRWAVGDSPLQELSTPVHTRGQFFLLIPPMPNCASLLPHQRALQSLLSIKITGGLAAAIRAILCGAGPTRMGAGKSAKRPSSASRAATMSAARCVGSAGRANSLRVSHGASTWPERTFQSLGF
jgi:hypothetical protein